jgi:hypothetical protein
MLRCSGQAIRLEGLLAGRLIAGQAKRKPPKSSLDFPAVLRVIHKLFTSYSQCRIGGSGIRRGSQAANGIKGFLY